MRAKIGPNAIDDAATGNSANFCRVYTARLPGLLVLAALTSALACATGDDDSSPSDASAGLTTGTGDLSSTSDTSSTGDTDDGPTSSTSTATASTTSTTTSTTTQAETDPGSASESTTADTEDTACVPGELDCACVDEGCDEGLVCVDDLCAAPLDCAGDDNEPNETEATATVLPMITDDDDDESSVSGVLSGDTDVDWYRFIGTDTVFHTTEPTAALDTSGDLRFCMFLDCLEDGPALTEVSCPDGTDFAISPELRPGCCSSEGFELKDYNCPGGDDSLLVFLRLDKPLFDECIDYTVSYFL